MVSKAYVQGWESPANYTSSIVCNTAHKFIFCKLVQVGEVSDTMSSLRTQWEMSRVEELPDA